jgi:penicillin-binding protein 1A
MADWSYTEKELEDYFADPGRRKPGEEAKNGWFHRRFADPEKATAFRALAWIAGITLFFTLAVLGYLVSLRDELPPLTEIENPNFQFATIAYTADGVELARYARQNRAWVSYADISPHAINALIATEDHRFYDHWGIDLFRTASIPFHVLLGDPQGGSTISQQLARNLYNKRIGYEVTLARKLKEWVTAVKLERRYTKEEIIEMYLNTVEFGFNAWGLEAAARTFFGKAPIDLDELESATLVGMLNGITRYNPVRNPENSRRRRNVVLGQMVKNGYLDRQFLETHREDSVRTSFQSSELTASLAPYFAEHVRGWLNRWAADNGYDVYEDGLVVYTTLDSRMQKVAEDALQAQMVCLQAVVDFEWSRTSSGVWSTDACEYTKETGYEPFGHFWSSQPGLLDQLIRESDRYRSVRRSGMAPDEATVALRTNAAFVDSLKAAKTRLEAGFVALDPHSGYVKAWVGGRDLATDWFDHVDKAARQPGSTFKPFVYTAAIDNGWSPYYTLLDDTLRYVDAAGNVWSPGNTGGMSGRMVTLREGLAQSKNTVTARLMLEVGPQEVSFIARRMGIKSPLEEVMSLALGTSDVTLLEMATAYSTLANGGLRYEPTAVTRIEDRAGNVLYEAATAPREALSEQTAYTMVDMLRGVITEGTGMRIRGQFGLTRHDLAGKTGTTQESADGWFMMMHPDLVMGSWVGFNDRRFTFRTDWWGQGAHTALLIVGDFFRALIDLEDTPIDESARFPSPNVRVDPEAPLPRGPEQDDGRRRGRVGW